MELIQRIQLLAKLGQNLLKNIENDNSVLYKAKSKNSWFTIENQEQSIKAIAAFYLEEENLKKWISLYDEKYFVVKSKSVGVICAGNIPLVGIHDLICVFISGHKALVKLSSKDEVLMKYVFELMYEIEPKTKAFISIVDRLQGHEAVIATGSNNSARYFDYYFRNVPLLLRKNRTSVAVLNGKESDEQIKNLAEDVFAYFGLGCRNVSKFYVPKGYDVTQIFEKFAHKMDLKNHHSYANNFEYNLSLYLLNMEEHFANEFFVMRENEELFSRLAVLHYEFYENQADLKSKLDKEKEHIQCIVGEGENYIPFGKAQQPQLWDYADGVDTLAFLANV